MSDLFTVTVSMDSVRMPHYRPIRWDICDRICKNPACRENAQVAQCAFLVPQVKNCQSPVFVIFMSKNLSTNYCRSLQRVNVSYQGEISLYLQAPRST